MGRPGFSGLVHTGENHAGKLWRAPGAQVPYRLELETCEQPRNFILFSDAYVPAAHSDASDESYRLINYLLSSRKPADTATCLNATW